MCFVKFTVPARWTVIIPRATRLGTFDKRVSRAWRAAFEVENPLFLSRISRTIDTRLARRFNCANHRVSLLWHSIILLINARSFWIECERKSRNARESRACFTKEKQMFIKHKTVYVDDCFNSCLFNKGSSPNVSLHTLFCFLLFSRSEFNKFAHNSLWLSKLRSTNSFLFFLFMRTRFFTTPLPYKFVFLYSPFVY